MSIIGIMGIVTYPIVLSPEFTSPSWFIIIASLQIPLYFIGGSGIIMKKLWGYYLLKTILYLFIIIFPIGTIFSVVMLKYIKKHNIKNCFSI